MRVGEFFSFFASFFLFSKESGGSPLTLPPNFKCEKGSVTAAAAACMPLRGSFVGGNKGSLEKGAGSRRLTEGFFCVTETLTKDFTEPLHQLANAV